MGLLDLLGGQSPANVPEDETNSAEGSKTQELLRDTAPTTSLSPNTEGRLYDPYSGISQAVVGRKAVFNLPEGPEFVFPEEAAVHRRSWSENLQYYTGVGYLGGGSTGMIAGAAAVLRNRSAEGVGTTKLTTKLLANRLLNESGHWGRKLGNGAGVLGLYFSIMESYFYSQNEGMLPDAAVTSFAGFSAAALFRAPRGPKAAVIAGAVGGVAAAGLAGLRSYFPSL